MSDVLFVKCQNCGNTISTGIAISRNSKGNVLENNTSGPCRNCGKMTIWDGKNAFYEDETPFSLE